MISERPMNRYLDDVFGERQGYVAVASKAGEGGTQWSEEVFSWPDARGDLTDWVHSRTDTDLFVCPAMRKTRARAKGDGAHLSLLWADVDWDKVPSDARARVQQRISKVASFIVRSGSGDNCHVYVRLRQPATLDQFRRLNQGLRDYLHADNKHADNSLLRIPGTRNRKPGAGRVTYAPGEGKHAVSAAALLKLPTWQAVVVAEGVDDADGSYSPVDVRHLLRGGIKSLAHMPIDEACGKYGTRHGAVFRVTAALAKRGLSSDEIHSLMDDFPAGVDKQSQERGYDLHTDVSRCLLQQPGRDAVQTQAAEDAVTLSDAFEEVPPETPDDRVHAKVLSRVEQWEIDRLAREYLAQRDFNAPPEDTTTKLSERLKMPSQPNRYAIDKIAGEGHNVTVTGQFKTGKTLFITNLVRAMSEHTPFLEEFKPRDLREGERVGMWSCETSESDLIEDYFRPQGMAGDNVSVWHARGYSMNIMTDVGFAWTVNWLKENHVGVWIIDSHARLCRMCGVEENDNGAVLGLLHRLDQIKLESGVAELFLIAHTGRGEMQEGRERARGATSLDDWTDARWVLTRDGDVRFLQAEGRNVQDLLATSLSLNTETKKLTFGGASKQESRTGAGVQGVVSIVTDNEGVNKRALIRLVREAGIATHQSAIVAVIEEAIECGFIKMTRGDRGSHLFNTTKSTGRATPAVVNMTNMKDQQRGREASRRRKRAKRDAGE